MNIQRNSQIWLFCDRYCSYEWSWRFEDGRGDICALVRGIIVAGLKCAGLTVLAFAALQMLTTPFLTLYLVGFPLNPGGPDSWLSFTGFFGSVIYAGAILLLFYHWVWLPAYEKLLRIVRGRKREVKPEQPPGLITEYYRAIKGKYCTRVTIT